MSSTFASYREVIDANGRVYRVGETDRELLGRSRAWMIWLPWMAMMAVSVYEYGYGAAAKSIRDAHHWSMGETFWLLSIWAFFQAGVAFPAGKLREKGILSPRAAMLIGAVLSALGFASITQGNLVLAYLGFAVCGGIGAGLVYATCINLVGKWYPERRGGKTGFVNGGFAYGAVPFIFIFSYALHPNTYVWVLDLVAAYMLIVCAVCGWLFRDPPKNWWPADVDPREVGGQQERRGEPEEEPACRAAIHADGGDQDRHVAADVAVARNQRRRLAFRHQLHGAVRQGSGLRAADRCVVRRRALHHQRHRPHGDRLAIGPVRAQADPAGRPAVSAVSLVGLLYAGKAHNEIGFLCFAFLVGFGGGAFYPMFASLTPDYFGENNNASNYGLVYSSKLLGSIVGIGVGASVIDAWGYTGAYWLAAVSALVSAGIATFLRQPGRAGARHRDQRITRTKRSLNPRWPTDGRQEAAEGERSDGSLGRFLAPLVRYISLVRSVCRRIRSPARPPSRLAIAVYQFGVLVPRSLSHAPERSASSTTAPDGRPTR